jgi:precorrin-2 dehydrogenase
MPSYYPIMLDVRGRPAVVVGGDAVAAEKAAALATRGAHVTAVAPAFGAGLRALAARPDLRVALREKVYEAADLDGAFVVVAATTHDPALSEAIWAETRRRGQLVNIVDVPARCAFIVPSILRRGQLTIAVSTEGASPSIAKRIRQRLEALFPPAFGPYLRLATAARVHLRAAGVGYARRDDFFGDYLASDALDRLEAGDAAGAAATTARLLEAYGASAPAAGLEAALGEEEAAHADV